MRLSSMAHSLGWPTTWIHDAIARGHLQLFNFGDKERGLFHASIRWKNPVWFDAPTKDNPYRRIKLTGVPTRPLWIVSLNEWRYPNICIASPSNARRRWIPFVYVAIKIRGKPLRYTNSKGTSRAV